jgi:hypothetical protein
MNIFETLKKLSKKDNQERKDPSYIYLEDNQVKERKLSELLDSAASVYINRTIYNPAKLIHDSIFH